MVLVEAPEGMQLETAAGGEVPEPTDSDVPETNEPAGLRPSDWAGSSSSAGWLATVIGSVAAVLVVGTIGGYAWLNRANTPRDAHEVVQANSAATVAHSDEELDATSNANQSAIQNDLATTESSMLEPADSRAIDGTEIGDADSVALSPADQRSDVVIVDATDPSTDKPKDLGVGLEVTDNVAVDQVFDEVAATASEPPPASSLLADASLTPKLEPARPSDGDTLSSLANLLASPKQTSSINMKLDGDLDEEDDVEQGELQMARSSDVGDKQNAVTSSKKTTLSNIQSSALASHSSISKHDIEAKLSREILAVRFNRVPLIDFLRSMSQISGVPIQLDPVAVMQTSVSASTSVTVSAIEDSTIDILTTALRPIKLTPVVHGHVVRIAGARSEDKSLVDYSFFAGDLSNGRKDELDLAALVTALVSPESWQSSAASVELRGERLKIRNSRRVLYDTLVLLEKLRKARGLASRKKVAATLASKHSRWSQINRYLAIPITVNMWQPEPWPKVVTELESVTGLRILVDWQALTETGIALDSTAMLRVRDGRASEVLRDWLDSFDLVLLPLGGKTVQLTSRSRMRQTPYLDVYPISKLSEKSMARVEQLLLTGAAALDSASDFAFVRTDSETHRQLAQ